MNHWENVDAPKMLKMALLRDTYHEIPPLHGKAEDTRVNSF